MNKFTKLPTSPPTTQHVPQSKRIFEKKYLPKRPIEGSIEVVAEGLGLKPELICSGSRQEKIAEARALVAYLAVEETGHKLTDVARILGVKRASIKQAVVRGKTISDKYPVLLEKRT